MIYGSQLTDSEAEFLENLIDSVSLATVIGAMGEICGEKASHISTNWQDVPSAKVWAFEADRLEKLAPLVGV